MEQTKKKRIGLLPHSTLSSKFEVIICLLNIRKINNRAHEFTSSYGAHVFTFYRGVHNLQWSRSCCGDDEVLIKSDVWHFMFSCIITICFHIILLSEKFSLCNVMINRTNADNLGGRWPNHPSYDFLIYAQVYIYYHQLPVYQEENSQYTRT